MKRIPEYTAEEVHNDLSQAYINYVTVMVTQSNNQTPQMENDMISLIKMYESIGAINTEQYRKLKSIENSISNNKNYDAEVNKQYDYLKKVIKLFPNAEIIPYTEYARIMLKYDLYDNTIDRYIKDIPKENVLEIDKALKASRNNLPLNAYKISDDIFGYSNMYSWDIIREIEIDDSFSKIYSNKLVNSLTRYPYTLDIKSVYNRIRLTKDEGDQIMGFTYDKLVNNSQLCIAAPREHFVEDLLKVTYTSNLKAKKLAEVKDPIVGWKSPIGVICISKWGEVTNEQIFKYSE